jgi:perosamine synthetase
MNKIHWWYTEIGETEKNYILSAFDKKCFSMGKFTKRLEQRIAGALDVPYVVLTNSGTSSLIMALLCIGVNPDDEVIVPGLTWIATGQAAAVLGAKVIIADCLPDSPIIDPEEVKKKIHSRTKAVIAVHLNGRSCDLKALKEIASNYGVFLIEDTCKGMFSREGTRYLGTIGDIGCFSMGMISLISVGYGGFVVTRQKVLYDKLKIIRDHGVVREPEEYRYLGINFKISDIGAAIGLGQYDRLEEKLEHVRRLHRMYTEGLSTLEHAKLLRIDVTSGKVPLYNEIQTGKRDELFEFLRKNNVETSKFHLPLHRAEYFDNKESFSNASILSRECLILPSGPSQSYSNIDQCIELIRKWDKKFV